jgi:phosphoglycerate dehydrogenase-like enzyme
LAKHTLGILGVGRIGSASATIARAFGMDVIGWSPNLTRERAEAAGVAFVSKDELFARADIVSVSLVLGSKTRGIVGAHEIGLMKPSAWLVNTSRGPLVDEASLIAALEGQRIAGAALDVFAIEPLPAAHPFRSLPNVLATSHVGFVTHDTYRIFFGDTVRSLVAWLDAG